MYILAGLLILAAVALAYGVRLFLTQQQLIFRPGRRLERSPSDFGAEYEQVSLPVGEGRSVEAWWIPAGRSRTTVAYFHGSVGNLTHELPTLRFLRASGLDVIAVEYPGYTDPGKPSEAGCYAAARAAWDHAVELRGVPPQSLVLFGVSLGGAVAIRLASERPCGGLVVQATFTSVPDLAATRYPYLPVRPFLRTRMNSVEHIRHVRAPVLVIHSRDDEHIPLVHARRLVAAASGPRMLVTLRGAHGDLQWIREERVHAAWRQLLAGEVAGWEHDEGYASS